MMMPYTPIEVMARMNNNPASMLASHNVPVNGITDHATSAGAKASTGANRNR